MANKQDGTPLLPMYDNSRSRATSMYGSTGRDATNQKKDGDARYARRSRTYRSIALAALVNSPSASLKVTNFTCCSSFGTVYFPTADNSAMFAVVALTRKLDFDVAMEIAREEVVDLFLANGWDISPQKPSLIITMNSGALTVDGQNSVMRRRTFMQGLIEAAVDAKAWFLTDGKQSDVTGLIGKARTQFGSTVPIIGIADLSKMPTMSSKIPEHSAHDHSAAGHSHGTSTHLHINYADEEMTKQQTSVRMDLQQEHSHFVLIRPHKKQPGVAEMMRTAVHVVLQERLGCHNVCLVLEGMPDFYEKAAIYVEHSIPLILLRGSGGVADSLAKIIEHWNQDHRICSGTHTGNYQAGGADCPFVFSCVKQSLESYFRLGGTKSDDVDMYCEAVYRCLEHTDLISAFDLPTELTEVGAYDGEDVGLPGLKRLILSSCIKQIRTQKLDRQTTLRRQLMLAIDWGRSDVAAAEIFEPMRERIADDVVNVSNMANVKVKLCALTECRSHPRSAIHRFQRAITLIVWHLRFFRLLRGAVKEATERRAQNLATQQTLQLALLHAMRAGNVGFVKLLWNEGAQLPQMFDVTLTLSPGETDFGWLSPTVYKKAALDAAREAGGSCSHNDEIAITPKSPGSMSSSVLLPSSHSTVEEPIVRRARNNEMLLRLYAPTLDPKGEGNAANLSTSDLPMDENSTMAKEWRRIWRKDDIGVAWHEDARANQEEQVQKFIAKIIGTGYACPFGMLGCEFDLMLWAIMFDHADLAMMFWHRTKEPLFCAMVAAVLCQRIAEHPDTSIASVQNYSKNHQRFESVAADMLAQAQAKSMLSAIAMLERRWYQWSFFSVLDIAMNCGQVQFISRNEAHVLKCLQARWRAGLMPSNDIPLAMPLQMLIGLIFPPFVAYLNCNNLWVFFVLKGYGKLGNKLFRVDDGSSEPRRPSSALSNSPLRPVERSTSPPVGAEPIDFIQPTTFVPTLAMKYFVFYKSPMTQFLLKAAFYVAFLVLYSINVTHEFSGDVDIIEWFIALWVMSLFIELWVELLSGSKSVRAHLSDTWHQVDCAMMCTYFVGFGARLMGANDTAKILCCISGIMFYIRALQIFSVHPRLGPLLTVLGRMLADVAAFFSLMFVIVMAFGVAFRGMLMQLDPDSRASKDAMWRVYYNLYGKLFAVEMEEEPEVVKVTFAIYMVIAVILLLTLLIAMLTSTYDVIRSTSSTVWLAQYYNAIVETKQSTGVLPPPVSLLQRLLQAWSFVKDKVPVFGRKHQSNENRAASLFDQLDVFKAGRLHRVQLQQIVDGMSKLPNLPHNFVTLFVDHMQLEGSQSIVKTEFVHAVSCWIDEIAQGGISPDVALSAIVKGLSLFETRWERDERRRVSEFEVQLRRSVWRNSERQVEATGQKAPLKME